MSVTTNGQGTASAPGIDSPPGVDAPEAPHPNGNGTPPKVTDAVTDETVTDETVTDETVTDETVTDETVTDETVTEERVTDGAEPEETPQPSVSVRARGRRLTPPTWLVLGVLTVLLVGAGAWAGNAVAQGMTKLYAAHADVLYPLVQEQPTGFLREDRNISTQEVLLESRTVLDPVAEQFGIPVEDLADALTTTVVDESEIIRVDVTDPSRAQARKILVAVLTRYLEISNNPQRTELRAYLDTQLVDIRARLATARASTIDNQGEIDVLVQREAQLLAQIDEEQLSAIAGPAPQITVPPYVEHDPVSPKPLIAIGGGALAGLVVALLVVAVVARRLTRP